MRVLFWQNSIKDAIFTKGLNILLSGQNFRPFWPENAEKSWQHCHQRSKVTHCSLKSASNALDVSQYLW
jgi:hypothetical protein